MRKIIFIAAALLAFAVLLIGFLGVITPDGGCPLYLSIFTPKLRDRYMELEAENCGKALPQSRQGNVTLIYECLQKAMEQCRPSKAFIAVAGYERRFEYLYLTNKKCKVQITRGGCGAKTDTCNSIVPFEVMSRPNYFKTECAKPHWA